jgi:hypothetical protein
MVDPRRGRIAAPAPARWKITGGTGRKDQTMREARRPRKLSGEQIVQLLVGAANALARLFDAFHRWH